MNIKTILLLSLLCLISGSIFFLFHKEYIILRFRHDTLTTDHPLNTHHTYRKTVTCHFWHKNSWQKESQQCLWSDNKETNLKQLISTWLITLEQECSLPTKITTQAVVLNPNGYGAFVSFNQNPLPQNGPLYHKIIWIEGLLKTIRDNGVIIQSIHFLHNHQPLQDPHLDFSQPWPICGFLNT